ncbi:MAG: hypothetical protein ACI83Y_002065 [Candidatus Azotimanducaceae bacterium]|jgi:hypothetical protein|tara:strand:+ start:82 stop:639 length:558 start_codon:yes stop_codon:yes gene_type:complete
MSGTLVAGKVTVAPAQFVQVKYDAAEIAALVTDLAEQLGVSNPIELTIDETTPLAKIVSELDAVSSDAVIRITAQSGALENTKVLTTLGPVQTRVAVGRMLLRARDRMRDDFADAPADCDLTREQNAAWDTYCAGRLLRAGCEIHEQRWRYNHRNRFGFSDAVDTDFDRLWAADDLGWASLIPGT